VNDLTSPSYCDRCGDVFSELTDELAYFRSSQTRCKTCGAAPYWERKAANRNAFSTNPEKEYVVVQTLGRTDSHATSWPA
jgi:hypothetical protein